ncbi:unnamed protein product [Mytilus coruscus]|uniref:C1q domain-containing protein n=1 Tax=Mytilus coruscus TaxID=42192 RepID=A0A6J8B784_MYTCO|nr:unnamed protein product [Mytilus coruscus]
MLMLIFYGVLFFCCGANGVRAPVYANVDLGKGNDDKHGDIRESIASMKSDIESLKLGQKRVSMVACLKGSFTASGAGSVNRGLYMVFATITSRNFAMYKLMKNKTSVSRGLIGGNKHWSSGSSIAFVQLEVEDHISVVADQRMQIGDRSCFGVIKID